VHTPPARWQPPEPNGSIGNGVATQQRARHPSPRGRRGKAALTSERMDPLRLALCLMILVGISRIHQQFGFIGAVRPALLLFVFSCGFALLRPNVVDWSLLTKTFPGRALLGLTLLALLSIPFGISLGASATFFLETYSKVLLTGILFVIGIRTPRNLWYVCWAFVISCGIWAIMAFTVFDVSSTNPGGHQRLAGLHMFDSNDLGLILVMGLPLTLFVIETTRSWAGKMLGLACLGGIGGALAMTGSRGGMVGLVIVLFCVLATANHVAIAKRVGFVGVVVTLLVVAAPAGYWKQMQTIVKPQEDYNWTATDGRKQVTARGIAYMKARPIFGLGVSNFARAEGTISSLAKNRIAGTGIRWTAPHNTWIEVGSEMGVFALMIWIAVILKGSVGLLRLRRSIPKEWRQGTDSQRIILAAMTYVPLAFIGFAATSTFVSFAYIMPFYFLSGLLAVVLRALDVSESGKKKARGKKVHVGRGPMRRPIGAAAYQSLGGRRLA